MKDQGKLKDARTVSPLLRVLGWLDYPKINRLNRTFKDLKQTEGDAAKIAAVGAIETKFFLVSVLGCGVGWMLGRTAASMFVSQAAFLVYQYDAESKLQQEGRLQQPITQTIAGLSTAAAISQQLAPPAPPRVDFTKNHKPSWEKECSFDSLDSSSIERLVASLPTSYF